MPKQKLFKGILDMEQFWVGGTGERASGRIGGGRGTGGGREKGGKGEILEGGKRERNAKR